MTLRKRKISVGHPWLMPVILATQETEIKRVKVGGQLGEIVLKTLSGKYPAIAIRKACLQSWPLAST
jgi:hypothetical protein